MFLIFIFVVLLSLQDLTISGVSASSTTSDDESQIHGDINDDAAPLKTTHLPPILEAENPSESAMEYDDDDDGETVHHSTPMQSAIDIDHSTTTTAVESGILALTSDYSAPEDPSTMSLSSSSSYFSSSSSNPLSVHHSEDPAKRSEIGSTLERTDVIIIAVCVTLVSLVIIVMSVVMTFLVRRRMRRKAYLRVKHASQSELAVRYVQNTSESAQHDSALEQFFESLHDSAGPRHNRNDFESGFSSDDENDRPRVSPSGSIIIVSDAVAEKSRTQSRSMPSLKNFSAHEEALGYNFVVNNRPSSSFVPGKFKGRSRSFTERAFSRVDAAIVNKDPIRDRQKSHSEKGRRSNIVSMLMARKGSERNKAKRASAAAAAAPQNGNASTPLFKNLVKINFLKNRDSRKNKADAKEQTKMMSKEPTIEMERIVTIITAPSDPNLARCSENFSDFKLPSTSPILEDLSLMLAAFNGSANESRSEDSKENETTGNESRDFVLDDDDDTYATDKLSKAFTKEGQKDRLENEDLNNLINDFKNRST